MHRHRVDILGEASGPELLHRFGVDRENSGAHDHCFCIRLVNPAVGHLKVLDEFLSGAAEKHGNRRLPGHLIVMAGLGGEIRGKRTRSGFRELREPYNAFGV